MAIKYFQEYMQGWYAEYCAKTGQFCDQVKLKHSTKDKKTGSEIVYNVESSAGYNPEPAGDGQHQLNNNDIEELNSYKTTTMTPTTTSTATTSTTTTFDYELIREKMRERRRKALAEKMRNMFRNLGHKFKEEKKKILKVPKELFESRTTTSTSTLQPVTTTVLDEVDVEGSQVPLEGQENGDYFYDFVPMEYQVVEDVIIDHY